MKTKTILIILIAMLAVTALVFQSCEKDEPVPEIRGTFTDPRDGQIYDTVDIANQTWFAENLNYDTTNSWWHDNSSSTGNIYGRLYTWEAALTACPSGWHLPTDEEWKTMEMALGMSQSEADEYGLRGTDEGKKMKETGIEHWWGVWLYGETPYLGSRATNTSGFTALPGSFRLSSGYFIAIGYRGLWWSSSESSGTHAWGRELQYDYKRVYRSNDNKTHGFSVRCLKD